MKKRSRTNGSNQTIDMLIDDGGVCSGRAETRFMLEAEIIPLFKR